MLKKLGINSLKEFFSALLVFIGIIMIVGTLLTICYSFHWLLGLLITGFLFIVIGIGITNLV